MNLVEKIMTEFPALKPKMYSYLTDSSDEEKKKRNKKKCVIKGKLKFEDYKHCLEATQLENKINQLEQIKPDVDSLSEINIKNKKILID